MKHLFLIALLAMTFSVNSQTSEITNGETILEKAEASPYFSHKKGLGFTAPDSIYQINLRFRMQNRATYYQVEDGEDYFDATIKRLRLRLDGYVFSPKIEYSLQLSFASGDVGTVKEGDNVNIIRDAIVAYSPTEHWKFIFGQTKLLGNRQRTNSSGSLQLTDRSINNAKFTIDRDFGIQAYYLNEDLEKFSYNLKAAVSSGEGRNSNKSANDGVAVTAKAELFPFGAFEKDGTYFEGDLVREKSPKLLLSGGFQQNNHALRTQGQLGDDLFEARTIKSVFIDAMVKYQGWAAMSAYMSRNTSESAFTTNPLDTSDFNYVYTGSGFDYQLSYVFKNNYEVAGRYSLQKVHREIEQLAPDNKQLSFGVTKYIWDHKFKLQTELTYDMLDYYDGSSKNNWYVRFQVEIGI